MITFFVHEVIQRENHQRCTELQWQIAETQNTTGFVEEAVGALDVLHF